MHWYTAQIRNTKGKLGKTVVGCLPLVAICLFLSICQGVVTGGTRTNPLMIRAGFVSTDSTSIPLVQAEPTMTQDPRELEPTATLEPTVTLEPTDIIVPTETMAPTDVPPTATAEPTATLQPTPTELPSPTVTQGPPEARASSTVRMRYAPSAEGAVLDTLDEGTVVALRFRSSYSATAAWYSVERPDGTIGWVSGEYLALDPAVADALPVRSVDDAVPVPPTTVPAPIAEEPAAPAEDDCDPSYPDFCIPVNSADLDCDEVPYSDFTVYQPDPHDFDRDRDGIGCES